MRVFFCWVSAYGDSCPGTAEITAFLAIAFTLFFIWCVASEKVLSQVTSADFI